MAVDEYQARRAERVQEHSALVAPDTRLDAGIRSDDDVAGRLRADAERAIGEGQDRSVRRDEGWVARPLPPSLRFPFASLEGMPSLRSRTGPDAGRGATFVSAWLLLDLLRNIEQLFVR